jgi:hypothetical protein
VSPCVFANLAGSHKDMLDIILEKFQLPQELIVIVEDRPELSLNLFVLLTQTKDKSIFKYLKNKEINLLIIILL